MARAIPEWLSRRGARELFEQFPLPLAITDARGARLGVNHRFEQVFGDASAGAPALAALLGRAGSDWAPLRLPGRDGLPVEARARSIEVPDGMMLVIDEAPAVEPAALDELRGRIAELERLSATDPLTGAWNRFHLDRTVEAEIGRSMRARQPVSLVLLDIDHFKHVNDESGHVAGDGVLRALVEVVRSNVRAADGVYRWGGEEFLVLAPATGHRAAAKLAEKLRAAVAAHAFGLPRQVTVSAGVAEHLAGESPEAWFARVDAALYRAKHAGRNRIEVDARGSSDAWRSPHPLGTLRLAWDAVYECGQPDIDAEHRALFEQANALIEAAARPEPDAVEAAFRELVEGIERHFRHEESILAARRYPGLEQHAHAHARLLHRAREIEADARDGQVDLGEVVNFIVNDVVARHLFTADRRFFPLFLDEPRA